ncbi:MAG: type VI secretion system baseplate subunit TssF [Verrucomicrobiales bacterium]|nr:type VI secretion system baseplate subunit TssF [Verrucomicrobiales bacterium]
MDERLLNLYETELRHLQWMLQDYRKSHEKIAGRLYVEEDGRCQDPWVQRLLEGFAFLAARIHRRMDDEFPRFTQGLIETTYPDFLCPVPSMGIFEFRPDGSVPDLMAGREIPRGTSIRTRVIPGSAHPVCEFRTAHPVRLTSLVLNRLRYLTRELDTLDLPPHLAESARSALVLGLSNLAPAPIAQVQVDELDFFVGASGEARALLTELLVAGCRGWVVRDPEERVGGCLTHSSPGIGDVVALRGLADEEAMLATDRRSFSGFRLLREYFCLPERLQFFQVAGFGEGLRLCRGRAADLVLVFDREWPQLARLIDEEADPKGASVSAVRLYCTPAINLFPKSMERISLEQGGSELRLLADSSHDLDYEVHRVERVEGIGDSGQRQLFRPFFQVDDRLTSGSESGAGAFYTVRRSVRSTTLQEREAGSRRSYLGSEVFLTLVDEANAPQSPNLRQLKVECLCSNRHLPRELSSKVWLNDLVASPSPPYLKQVVLLGQISEPQMAETQGESAWQFISHLSLNLAELAPADGSPGSGAGLREVLRLQTGVRALSARRQIDGVKGVRIQPEIGRLGGPGPPAFVRGLRVTLEVDEQAFHEHSLVLFGAVIAQFLARHVTLNSFVKTVLWSTQRNQEILRWPAQSGLRRIL